MTTADREQIALLAARFVEPSEEIMSLAEVIENAIIDRLNRVAARRERDRHRI